MKTLTESVLFGMWVTICRGTRENRKQASCISSCPACLARASDGYGTEPTINKNPLSEIRLGFPILNYSKVHPVKTGISRTVQILCKLLAGRW